MPAWTRRDLLGQGACFATAGLLAPAGSALSALGLASEADTIGELLFLNEGPVPLAKPTGQGLSGRLALDLSRLSEQRLVTPSERFFIRTRVPSLLPATDNWSIRLTGLAGDQVAIGISELRQRSVDQGAHLLECAGNGRHRRFGLLSAARWSGVALTEFLEAYRPRDGATRVLIEGNDDHLRDPRGSTRGAGWIFTPEQLADAGAFLATEMNGKPLTPDHGFPVRLLVPGWYGCSAAKWVESIRWVGDDEPGTSQMREYAGRTHHNGIPDLARDYLPAEVDLAAMPVRVEMKRGNRGVFFNVVGIVWGGTNTTDKLEIRFGEGPWLPVERHDHRTNRTWSLWSHTWEPRSGRYDIALRVDDPSLATRRLDTGHYTRTVEVA